MNKGTATEVLRNSGHPPLLRVWADVGAASEHPVLTVVGLTETAD
jgi:hypothetical protein